LVVEVVVTGTVVEVLAALAAVVVVVVELVQALGLVPELLAKDTLAELQVLIITQGLVEEVPEVWVEMQLAVLKVQEV
jgi:hypothetical protein